MIAWLNHMFSIFNKPNILWSEADHFQALLCYAICIGALVAVVAVIFVIALIIGKIKSKINKKNKQ